MAAAAAVSLLMVLVLVLLLVGLGTGIALWLTAGKPHAHGEMACGGCGYSVRGLEQMQCPECGADLRTVGITGGGSAGRRTTGIVLTLVCGLLLLSCCGFTGFSWLLTARSSTPYPTTGTPAPIQAKPTPTAQPVPIQDPVDGDANDAGSIEGVEDVTRD
ncbi:MAG: hypothetical protein ACIAXF_11680 [Phycisphaerales bacterium JB063]